jgi:hypothetical protein
MMMNLEGLIGSSHGLTLWYYPSICPEGLSKTMKTSIRIAGHQDQDMNPGLPEYEAGSRRLVIVLVVSRHFVI